MQQQVAGLAGKVSREGGRGQQRWEADVHRSTGGVVYVWLQWARQLLSSVTRILCCLLEDLRERLQEVNVPGPAF